MRAVLLLRGTAQRSDLAPKGRQSRYARNDRGKGKKKRRLSHPFFSASPRIPTSVAPQRSACTAVPSTPPAQPPPGRTDDCARRGTPARVPPCPALLCPALPCPALLCLVLSCLARPLRASRLALVAAVW
ncbi:hypothetical protein LZ32DRAFT_601189 [Colletotrichum eremochloae]|nr:hypothetical protein LZ32DRAFT_601189 [Colletotrichum eremochloae]